MTDTITTAPIAFRSIAKSYPTPLRWRLAAAVGATFAAVCQAFAMAYVAPYSPRPSAAETDLQGRDANW